MNLTCYNSTDPHSLNVTNIYNDMVATGSLWKGEPSDIIVCSNTSPPNSSSCVPCVLEQTVHVVCKDLPEKVKLVMEAVGQNIIDVIKADDSCPTFLEPGLSGTEVPAGRIVEETGGPFPWWAGLIIAVGVIIIICGLVYKKTGRQRRQRILEFGRRLCRCANPSDTKDRSMNGDCVDQPQGVKVVDGTSTPLMQPAALPSVFYSTTLPHTNAA